jgi:hypothetical protein
VIAASTLIEQAQAPREVGASAPAESSPTDQESFGWTAVRFQVLLVQHLKRYQKDEPGGRLSTAQGRPGSFGETEEQSAMHYGDERPKRQQEADDDEHNYEWVP